MYVTMYEPREHVGRGVAYSIPDEHLLLNVPAGRLSIDPDRPSDFVDWCAGRGHRVDGGAFLARSWFGAYTEARMMEKIGAASGVLTLRRVRERAERITVDGERLHVLDAAGGKVGVDHAVLALGHGPTRIPEALVPVADSPLLLRSPWDEAGMARIAEHAQRVLLVGTGLTMCDAAITLSRLGYDGEMTAISRRGLLPQVHGESDASGLIDWRERLPVGSLRTLCREIRRKSRTHEWRSVIDSLRARTGEFWGSLSRAEQDRFVRRIAPYWDSHRHRLPPECHGAIGTLRDQGALRVLRAHLGRVTREKCWLTCEIRRPDAARTQELRADAIVLCTGPEPDPSRWGSALIDGLIGDGLASPEANGLGLRSTAAGLLIVRDAAVLHCLSTIGPLRRGALWESTAVPEISVQARDLGQLLVGLCEGDRGS